MEKTKFWVVTSYSAHCIAFGYTVVGLCLSEEEAKFQVKKLEKSGLYFYKYSPIELMDYVDKNSKEYKSFIKEEIENWKKEISKKELCKSKDTCDIQELKDKISKYENN